jgi:hypothetical protein
MTNLWNWRFALLLFVANELSAACSEYARAVRENRFMDLPMWNRTTFGTMFLTLNVPFYWLNLALFVGGFFFLPWQTLLIVAAAVFVAGIPTSTFLMRTFNLFVRVLVCYVFLAAVLVAIAANLV